MDRLSLDETRSRLKLSLAEAYKYLRKLDEFEILTWEQNDVLKIPPVESFVFERSTVCIQKWLKLGAIQLLNECFESKPAEKDCAFLTLTIPESKIPQVQKEFADMLSAVSQKYPYQGLSQPSESLKPVRFLYCVRSGELRL